MNVVIRRIKKLIQKYPGGFLLFLLLLIISIVTLKPGFYMMGWDNYSSYFRPDINIFRTLFATWRDYRGLGVPSDAEVTDVFRQLFYWVFHFFLPAQLLDQIYYLFALWVGIFSMYACAHFLSKDFYLGKHRVTLWQKELFAMLVALLYLFNLNTLSVFYSPIIPFTNRFYSLPLTLYVLLLFLSGKKSVKGFLVLALTIILTSGSYITPTVIITTLPALFIFLLFRFDLKKAFIYSIIVLLLNSFWVFPFLNYTIQKSSIIPLARTFVEINESTLNSPGSDFSLAKQSILYPSFLNLSFSSLSPTQFSVHPLLSEYTTLSNQYILYVYPVLYAVGLLLMLFHWKKNKNVFWIPIWILLFLFLSTKEFGPLGFVYIAIKTIFPLFGILFRISDTKFHAYINIAGSFAGAYGIVYILSLFRKKSLRVGMCILLFLVAGVYSWEFRTYFTGDLIGFFSYTKVPQAYFDIATVINNTPGNGRVLQLPMDKWHSYWRSFSWGYVGSAFFNYFINKPYVDKTFEPGSLQNSYLHSKINSLIDSFYRTTDPGKKKELAVQFLTLLQQSRIQFVLLDQSVSATVYARSLLFSTEQWYSQSKAIFDYLNGTPGLFKVASYPIDLATIYAQNANLYPIKLVGLAKNAPQMATVDLYQITPIVPMVQSLPVTQNIDPGIPNVLEEKSSGDSQPVVVQDNTKVAQLLPFSNQKNVVTVTNQSVELQYKNPNPENTAYTVSTTPEDIDAYLVNVTGKIQDKNLLLSFSNQYYPDLNGNKFSLPIGTMSFPLPKTATGSAQTAHVLSNWTVNSTSQILDAYRIKINDVFIPLPATLSAVDAPIGSVMIHEKEIRANVFSKSGVESIPLSTFTQTTPPSCFGEPEKPYQGSVTKTSGTGLALSAQYGSTCAQSSFTIPKQKNDISYYSEIELQIANTSNTTNDKNITFDDNNVKKILVEKGTNESEAYVCLHESYIQDCLNAHRTIRLSSSQDIFRLPLRYVMSTKGSYVLALGLVNINQNQQQMNLSNVMLHLYTPGVEQKIAFTPKYPSATVTIPGPLTVSFPKAASVYSYMQNPVLDGFYMPIQNCHGTVFDPRLTRYLGDTLVSIADNCNTHFAQWLAYNPTQSYLFNAEYYLGSGQQPTVVLGKNGDNYFFERASLYQGYPNLPGMKTLQDPQLFGSTKNSTSAFQDLPLTSMSRLIDPLYWTNSLPADTAIHLFQDTANEGILGVRAFNMVEYPLAWRHMVLTPANSTTTYNVVAGPIKTQQLLPSLWKVEGEHLQRMVEFNEGYDRQWGIYDSVWGVLFGKSLAISSPCNGYANCFELPADGIQRNTLYVLYWPERLSEIGWAVTAGVILLSALMLRRKRASL